MACCNRDMIDKKVFLETAGDTNLFLEAFEAAL